MVYIDGRWFSPDEAKISVFDHGLLYGDGVFEGIRFYAGRVFKLDPHLDRMYRSAHGIGLVPPIGQDELRRVVLEACARSGFRDGYLRPLFTRGKGDLGIDPRKSPRPSVVVICATIAMFSIPEGSGIRVIVASRRKVPASSLDPRVKSLNYLNSVLAKSEANARGADEAILLDEHSNVAEGSAENVFLVRDGTLVTPPTSASLEGITRETVVDLARGVRRLEVRPIALQEMFVADEVFLTGTGGEILPVVEVEGRRVGNGKQGPVTQEIRRAYSALVRSTGTLIPYDS
ncbi:MAG: branched-chain-amino-acid transaminase [Thermoplasmata archaeon]|nr:branched-chain-amino-acid transaminase [Thermoplasmata archaeon]